MNTSTRLRSRVCVACLGAAIAVTLAALLWTVPSRNTPPFDNTTALHCGDAVPKRGTLDFYRTYAGTGGVSILPGDTYRLVVHRRKDLPTRPQVDHGNTTYYHFETVNSSTDDYRVLCQPNGPRTYTGVVYAVPSKSRFRDPLPLLVAALVGFPLLIVGAILGLRSRARA